MTGPGEHPGAQTNGGAGPPIPGEVATGERGAVFISIEGLAARWGVTIEAIRALRKRGKLPPAQPLPLRVVRWRVQDIERLERRLREGGHESC